MTTSDHGISNFLSDRIAAGDFPSAVYLVAEQGHEVFADALGNSVVAPSRIGATLDTIYDLASLTKPLITGLLCARRVESGELQLTDPIARYLPEFARTDQQAITIRHLLTHTSGLPAWRPLYILASGEPEKTVSAIANLDLEYAPGTRVIYSDLGFILLGRILEQITGKLLAELARDEIFAPLGLRNTFFNPEQSMQTGIAACEMGNAYERDTCRNSAGDNYKGWREELIWGQVHDGNAHFLGGAAGHAGLFSTARETLMLATQFLANANELAQTRYL